jgi:hypothetical protein
VFDDAGWKSFSEGKKLPADQAVNVVFSLGDLPPGGMAEFSYAYALSQDTQQPALTSLDGIRIMSPGRGVCSGSEAFMVITATTVVSVEFYAVDGTVETKVQWPLWLRLLLFVIAAGAIVRLWCVVICAAKLVNDPGIPFEGRSRYVLGAVQRDAAEQDAEYEQVYHSQGRGDAREWQLVRDACRRGQERRLVGAHLLHDVVLGAGAPAAGR